MSPTHALTRTIDGAAIPAAGRWIIDPAHTSAEFVARHLVIAKVRGVFSDVEGSIVVGENPSDSSVDVTISTASISTGTLDRDGHLKSAEFLDIETYPEIRFVAAAIESHGTSWKLAGDLTIRDLTEPLTLDFDFLGIVDDPWGSAKAVFSASAEINRHDWDLSWNVALDAGGYLVSDKITLEIEIQAAPET